MGSRRKSSSTKENYLPVATMSTRTSSNRPVEPALSPLLMEGKGFWMCISERTLHLLLINFVIFYYQQKIDNMSLGTNRCQTHERQVMGISTTRLLRELSRLRLRHHQRRHRRITFTRHHQRRRHLPRTRKVLGGGGSENTFCGQVSLMLRTSCFSWRVSN